MSQSVSTTVLLTLLILVAGAALTFVASLVDGAFFWLLTTVGVTLICVFVRMVFSIVRPTWTGVPSNVALVVASLGLTLTLAEVLVTYWSANPAATDRTDEMVSLADPLLVPGMLQDTAIAQMRSRVGVVALPPEWRRRTATVPGAYMAYRWHDTLHVMDIHRFRRATALPDPDSRLFRVLAVGDSLTYGAGVASSHTYSARLERYLNESHRVEVLNLGVNGHQSEDILGVVRKFVPELQPDLVIYGVCLNDFLPSGIEQFRSDAYAVPLPEWLKRYFVRHSRLAAFLESRYDVALINMGFRKDFIEDILSRDFDANRARFAQDVRNMKTVLDADNVPGVAMVLHQNPSLDGPDRKTALAAETELAEAGFQVIPSEVFFEHFDGQVLTVSAWEGHPNELAHAVFASLFAAEITALPALQAYRRISP